MLLICVEEELRLMFEESMGRLFLLGEFEVGMWMGLYLIEGKLNLEGLLLCMLEEMEEII
jgi:hypothetical protein